MKNAIKINGETYLVEEIEQNCGPIDIEELYRHFLKDSYGDVEICGQEFDAAYALEKLDETAFRCGFNDWLDSMSGEIVEVGNDNYYVDEIEDQCEPYEDLFEKKENDSVKYLDV